MMNRLDVLRDLKKLYYKVVIGGSNKTYYEYEHLIDCQYEKLETFEIFPYDKQEKVLLEEIAQFHESVVRLMEAKQLQMTRLNEMTRNNYHSSVISDSYFFDKQT